MWIPILLLALITLQNLSYLLYYIYSEIHNTTIYRLIEDQEHEITIGQYICFVILDTHSLITFTVSETFVKIFCYRITCRKFCEAKWYCKPFLLTVNATCHILNSMMYSLWYQPNRLMNHALTTYLEQLTETFHRN